MIDWCSNLWANHHKKKQSRVSFSFASAIPHCPQARQPLTSPGTINFKHQNGYSPFSGCAWFIQAPAGQRVKISVDYIDIDQTVGCTSDFLSFVDGRPIPGLGAEFYRCYWWINATCYRFCGNSTRSVGAFESSKNLAGVIFHSDYQVQRTGFIIKYQFVSGERNLLLLR